ncbi:MAG: hypothetical protein LLF28_02225 [Nitrospiraceae bacterium]|nr:hypothetical protein [Nitrospiraceae bacterium]
MKRIIALMVAMLFVFAVTSISIAADEKKATTAPVEKKVDTKTEKKAEKKAEKKVKEKIQSVTGEVKAVDAVAKTITVAGKKKGDVVIIVDDKTLADVKAGDKVLVKYTTADGKNTAKSVMKQTSAKKDKKDVKKAEPKKEEPVKKEPAKK